MQQTGVWNDLCRHELIDDVNTFGNAATANHAPTCLTPVINFGRACTLAQRVVAVEADDVATLRASPVNVEHCGTAAITHLSNPLNRTLPSNIFCTRNHSLQLWSVHITVHKSNLILSRLTSSQVTSLHLNWVHCNWLQQLSHTELGRVLWSNPVWVAVTTSSTFSTDEMSSVEMRSHKIRLDL